MASIKIVKDTINRTIELLDTKINPSNKHMNVGNKFLELTTDTGLTNGSPTLNIIENSSGTRYYPREIFGPVVPPHYDNYSDFYTVSGSTVSLTTNFKNAINKNPQSNYSTWVAGTPLPAPVTVNNINDITSMWGFLASLRNAPSLDLSNFDTRNITDFTYIFNGCDNLTHIDLTNLDFSSAVNMSGMFDSCDGLKSVNLSNLNTHNVTDISGMFHGCPLITSIDLRNFVTTNVTDMDGMFGYCSSLTSLDVSTMDTRNVVGMRGLFNGCTNLKTINMTNFDTSKVTDMSYMFINCSSLTSLDLSNFDISNVQYVDNMFYNCSKLTSVYVSSSSLSWWRANSEDLEISSSVFKVK